VKVSYSDDVDATWTVKCGQPIYGYKIHMTVDEEHGFILAGNPTGANVADTTEMGRVLKASGAPSGIMGR